MSSKKNTLGLTVKKEQDFSEWYTQLLQKAELIEYSAVSGCYILRPNSYHIWEKVQEFFDRLIKADGVKNAYFPLFIPESLLANSTVWEKSPVRLPSNPVVLSPFQK